MSTKYTYRCLNCGQVDNYKEDSYHYKICLNCKSYRMLEVIVKGNPSQRQAIRAGFDQVRPGLWLHFAAKRMIIHKYRGDCPWSIFIGEGNKGWLEMFSVQTLSDAVAGKQRKKANKK